MRRARLFLTCLVLLVSAGVAASPSAASSPAPSPTPAAATFPLREPAASPGDSEGNAEADSASEAGDASRPYVDIERVIVGSSSQPHWILHLADAPPTATTLDSTHTVISYGLAFETTGDEVVDYVVGISNEGSDPGTFLVWVTDLATGDSVEQDGPPYGYPVEFAHPDEGQVDGEAATRQMVFTFLNAASRPPGVGLNTRFYAWASVEEDGALVAWDYAPNAGWIGSGAPSGVVDEPEVAVAPAGVPDELTGSPECWARTFAFVGTGTLRELGLDSATPVPPPDVERPAKIWVTGDLMPYDPGPEGGPVQMTRMLCFQFADGSGGSGWPVDPDWRPPVDEASASTDDAPGASPSGPVLVLVLLIFVLVAGGLLAFRKR